MLLLFLSPTPLFLSIRLSIFGTGDDLLAVVGLVWLDLQSALSHSQNIDTILSLLSLLTVWSCRKTLNVKNVRREDHVDPETFQWSGKP